MELYLLVLKHTLRHQIQYIFDFWKMSFLFPRILETLFFLFVGLAVASDSGLTLVGTWTTKSNMVFTGPGFYDPIDELLIEPPIPGRSYSFTEDGYYELAYYIVSPNAKDHSCPKAVLQWEHGSYEVTSDEKIVLTPITVDGRQLLSDPCSDKGISTYSRYSTNTTFSQYSIYVDSYNGKYRLQLYDTDGSPINALWLAYRPPMMLPTVTLNPTETTSGATSTSVSKKIKRSLENRARTNAKIHAGHNDAVWFGALVVLCLGAISYAFV